MEAQTKKGRYFSMKCILLAENSAGQKIAIKVIASNLPEALFCIAAEANQAYEDFPDDDCEMCQYRQTHGVCKNPLETFSREDEELIATWRRENDESNGGGHGQRVIRESV